MEVEKRLFLAFYHPEQLANPLSGKRCDGFTFTYSVGVPKILLQRAAANDGVGTPGSSTGPSSAPTSNSPDDWEPQILTENNCLLFQRGAGFYLDSIDEKNPFDVMATYLIGSGKTPWEWATFDRGTVK